MMKPATIDFSQFGSALGDKLGQMRQDRGKLPWARSDWQGAPQGAAMGWNRPMLSGNLTPMTEGGWRYRQMPQGRPMMGTMPTQAQGGPLANVTPAQGMPQDLWAMLQNRFQR